MKKFIPQVIAVTIICALLLWGTGKLEKMERISNVVQGNATNNFGSQNNDKSYNSNENPNSKNDNGGNLNENTDNNSSQEEKVKEPENLIKRLKKEGFTQLEAYKNIKSATDDEAFDYVISFTGDCLIATNEGQYYANCLDEVAN